MNSVANGPYILGGAAMKFYIASVLISYKQVHTLAQLLKSAGQRHTYDWTLQCEGETLSDAVAILTPQGRGTHIDRGLQSRRTKNSPLSLR